MPLLPPVTITKRSRTTSSSPRRPCSRPEALARIFVVFVVEEEDEEKDKEEVDEEVDDEDEEEDEREIRMRAAQAAAAATAPVAGETPPPDTKPMFVDLSCM